MPNVKSLKSSSSNHKRRYDTSDKNMTRQSPEHSDPRDANNLVSQMGLEPDKLPKTDYRDKDIVTS